MKEATIAEQIRIEDKISKVAACLKSLTGADWKFHKGLRLRTKSIGYFETTRQKCPNFGEIEASCGVKIIESDHGGLLFIDAAAIENYVNKVENIINENLLSERVLFGLEVPVKKDMSADYAEIYAPSPMASSIKKLNENRKNLQNSIDYYLRMK